MSMVEIPTFQPRLQVISREQALGIHAAALDILNRIGVKMEHAGVRAMLLENGCRAGEGDWIYIPGALVEDALRSAPKEIVIYDQLGGEAMTLAGENVYYGTGSDTTFTRDLETGERRRTCIQDTRNFARLADALPNISFIMAMSNPSDVPVEAIYVHNFAGMVENSNKPMVFLADNKDDIARIHAIACAVAGGEDNLRQKPFLLNYSEAISPLRFPVHVMDRLVFCAGKGIPICLPSGSNAGGGAPVTLAGALALGIAENLAGLVIHQLTAPGAPFLFGPNVSVLDMKAGIVSYGCPEWSLTQAALAQMRDEIYGLPVWGFAGATDAKVMDSQAGAESMFSIATSMMSTCNLIHDVGYMEYGNTSSPEMVVMANELIQMCRFFSKGIPVNEDTLALEAIERVGTGTAGQIFLSDMHTFQHFRSAQFPPKLLNRFRWEIWEKDGGLDFQRRCNADARRLVNEHQPVAKSDTVMAAIREILGA